MIRVLGIVYVTVVGVLSALHYEPLWLLVPITPIWLIWWIDSEEQRIRAEEWERFREMLRMTGRELE